MSDNLESSVLRLKLMDALRAESPRDIAKLSDVYNLSKVGNLLGLAVQVSNLEVVEQVLDIYRQSRRDINEPNADGNTPLHLAAIHDRPEVVKLLMAQPNINDTLANKEGLTPSDSAPNPQMRQLLSELQAIFVEDVALQLRQAFQTQNNEKLREIFDNPRVPEVIDINGIDPDTGSTVLHQSAAANNGELVEFILAHGGDPLLRDSQGRQPANVTSDEGIRRLLNNAAKSQAILVESIQGQDHKSAPKLAGYLKKWTNFTQGYKVRWFMLENNKLSYSKSPGEAIRGSVPLQNARVKVRSGENSRFEVKTPTSKYHLKAPQTVEANQWVWALQTAITFAKDQAKSGHTAKSRPQQSVTGAGYTGGARGTGSGAGSGAAVGAGAISGLSREPTNAANRAPASPVQPASHLRAPSTVSVSQSIRSNASTRLSRTGSSDNRNQNSMFVNDLDNDMNIDDDTTDDEEYDLQHQKSPPVTVEAMNSQLAALRDLLALLCSKADDKQVRDAIVASLQNIDVLAADVQNYSSYLLAEHKRLRVNLERSEQSQRMWAQTVRNLEIKVGKLEDDLHTRGAAGGPAAGTRKADDEDADDVFYDTYDEWQSHGKGAGTSPSKGTGGTTNSEVQQGQVQGSHRGPPQESQDLPTQGSQVPEGHAQGGSVQEPATDESYQRQASPSTLRHNTAAATGGAAAGLAAAGGVAAADGYHRNDADHGPPDGHQGSNEQGQASLQGGPHEQIKNEELDKELFALATSPAQKAHADLIAKEDSFAGYNEQPRKHLKLKSDDRPRISLWGILKNLIGKDMTRMTLPVTFNECTNLLQRSAEDMEYVGLLDKAASAVDDPGLRMAYVAAFAASSYSSTVNRVAKPFNPLLGETFEYCRPDMGFRLISEQVSHHPPIGALYADSPRWDFYGESNVKSKFNGRSFDINPLGLWYLNLRPDKGADIEEELYSFRKVTSSVVGIMVGNPVVDNYGEMLITNFKLGVTCNMSFKARGWRGATAYKLEGVVKDKDGKELYTIGGFWNDKVYATKVGSKGKLLLWQVHDRPPAPFNLTPFAITLNELTPELKPWLPPTDTRLRPDQRDMEEGRYDQAAEEKERLEEKQRATRRKREAEGITYEPRWFELSTHPVTGEKYYKPKNDYWAHREHHGFQNVPDIFNTSGIP